MEKDKKRKRIYKHLSPDKAKPHIHTYKSEAKSDKNRFFHQTKSDAHGATQTTTVTVNVQPSDDGVTGCFKGLLKCFGG